MTAPRPASSGRVAGNTLIVIGTIIAVVCILPIAICAFGCGGLGIVGVLNSSPSP